jgi:hypothetical protein
MAIKKPHSWKGGNSQMFIQELEQLVDVAPVACADDGLLYGAQKEGTGR